MPAIFEEINTLIDKNERKVPVFGSEGYVIGAMKNEGKNFL